MAWYKLAAKSTFLLARLSTDPSLISADVRSNERKLAIMSEKNAIMVMAPSVGEEQTFIFLNNVNCYSEGK